MLFVRFRIEQEKFLGGLRVKDARVRRTQRRLREALVSLIHERNYPRNRDQRDSRTCRRRPFGLLRTFPQQGCVARERHSADAARDTARILPPTVGRFSKALWFSFPVFEYVWQCRQTADAKMGRKGRAIMHQHLRRALMATIVEDVKGALNEPDERSRMIPADLLTEYIVATFILVLNWWVESRSPMVPAR